MDKIIRYYWICWDNSNGTEGEEIIRSKENAIKFFDQLTAPYKKLVACYNDRDETIMVHQRIF